MALWDFVVENVEAWREEINDYLALRQGESDETANTTYIEFNETVRRFVAFVAKTELSRYNDEAFRAEKALKELTIERRPESFSVLEFPVVDKSKLM
jgi:hypothetical protein